MEVKKYYVLRKGGALGINGGPRDLTPIVRARQRSEQSEEWRGLAPEPCKAGNGK